MNDTSIKTVKTFPSPIGITIIAVWGVIVVSMFLYTVKSLGFTAGECIRYNETGCAEYR